jgi:hypothetical protein
MPNYKTFKVVIKGIAGEIPYIFIPQVAEDVLVVAGVPHEPPLEEGDVEDGGVEVDELESGVKVVFFLCLSRSPPNKLERSSPGKLFQPSLVLISPYKDWNNAPLW